MKKSSFALLIALMFSMEAFALKITLVGTHESTTTDTWGDVTITCTPSEATCATIETMPGTVGGDVLKLGNGTVVRTGTFVSHEQTSASTHVVRFQ